MVTEKTLQDLERLLTENEKQDCITLLRCNAPDEHKYRLHDLTQRLISRGERLGALRVCEAIIERGGFGRCKSSRPASGKWPAPPEKPKPVQAVYFIGSRESKMVKIGIARNIKSRLSALQVGSPVKLELLGQCDGGKHRESQLHSRFAGDRAHGEWFHLTESIALFIESECTPRNPPEGK